MNDNKETLPSIQEYAETLAKKTAVSAFDIYLANKKTLAPAAQLKYVFVCLLQELAHMDRMLPELTAMGDLTYLHFLAEAVNRYGRDTTRTVMLELSGKGRFISDENADFLVDKMLEEVEKVRAPRAEALN